jgi:hypothetical protein
MWMFVVFEYVFSVCYLYLRTCTITVVPLLLFFCDACSFVGSCVVVARARLRLRACACPGCGLAFEVHSYGTNVSCLLLVGRGWEHNVQNDEIIT